MALLIVHVQRSWIAKSNMRALLLLSLLAGYQTKHFIVELDMPDSGNAKLEGEDNVERPCAS